MKSDRKMNLHLVPIFYTPAPDGIFNDIPFLAAFEV